MGGAARRNAIGEIGAAPVPRLELRGLGNERCGPFDLALAAGASAALVGASGVGKSVLLRMVADLDPHEGEALLDGVPRSATGAAAWRERVTYAAAEPGWWHEAVGAHFAAPPLAAAARLGLRADIFGQAVRLCSTGERQRLALLRALANRPAVLLLDEPTASLDADGAAAVEALLRERLAAGMALLFVTHDRAQADRLGDRRLTVTRHGFAA